jgi:hypothetical protein
MSDPVGTISTLLSFTDVYKVSISDYLLILLLSIHYYLHTKQLGVGNYFYLCLNTATLSDHNIHHKQNSVIKSCYTALRYSLIEYTSYMHYNTQNC